MRDQQIGLPTNDESSKMKEFTAYELEEMRFALWRCGQPRVVMYVMMYKGRIPFTDIVVVVTSKKICCLTFNN